MCFLDPIVKRRHGGRPPKKRVLCCHADIYSMAKFREMNMIRHNGPYSKWHKRVEQCQWCLLLVLFLLRIG